MHDSSYGGSTLVKLLAGSERSRLGDSEYLIMLLLFMKDPEPDLVVLQVLASHPSILRSCIDAHLIVNFKPSF